MPGPRARIVAGALACICTTAPAAAQALVDTGMFTATLRGLVHVDWMRDTGTGDVDLRRARIGVKGRVWHRVDYELIHDFRNSNAPWRDAYLNVALGRALEVRAGRFKVPFSAEELTSVSDLTFINRSLAATHLAPARDTGVMAHGRLFGAIARYQAAIFAAGGDNTRRAERDDRRHGALAAGRIAVRPFRGKDKDTPLAALSVAAAGTIGAVPEGPYSLAAGTLRGEPLFPTVAVNGTRRRVGAELEWRHDVVQLAAEWMRVVDERRGQGIDDGRLSDVVADGWHLSATAPLAVRDNEDRDPLIEVAARVEDLAFGSRARGTEVAAGFPNPRADVLPRSRNRAITAGIAWYARTHVKLQANVAREQRTDGPTRAAPAWLTMVRLQISL